MTEKMLINSVFTAMKGFLLQGSQLTGNSYRYLCVCGFVFVFEQTIP